MFEFLSAPDPIGRAAPPLLLKKTRKNFSGSADLEERFVRASGSSVGLYLLWLDGCVSSGQVSEEILRPLTGLSLPSRNAEEVILRAGVWCCSVSAESDADAIARALASGQCALFAEGGRRALLFDVKTAARRGVDAPSVEKSVLGPKDAFTETLRVNTSLVRRRLRTPQLVIREISLGRETGTQTDLLYLPGAEKLCDAVQQALTAREVPAVLSVGDAERLLTPPGGAFPRAVHTERPDRFAAGLLRGRVGILIDGVPVGLLLPGTLPEAMTVSEDSARHAAVAGALTVLRYVSLMVSLLLPAMFVAVAAFHPEMLPTKLLLSVIEAKQQVPFSTSAEVLGMLLAFELLQEAGIRLPDTIGQTVSIIGALIVGQSAVDARFISPIAVIVVAMAGICGYTLPSQEVGSALRLWRLGLVVCAALLGMIGIMAGSTLLLWRLAASETLGTAWLSPLCDGTLREARNTITGRDRK